MAEIDPLAHIRHLPVAEQIKYAFARRIYHIRDDVITTDIGGVKKTVTWRELWEYKNKKGGETYYEYVERMKTEFPSQRSKP